jgi:hypothetical protein
MLARGVNPYSVAKLVGITFDILERHYAPFIPELRERLRRALVHSAVLKAWKECPAGTPIHGNRKNISTEEPTGRSINSYLNLARPSVGISKRKSESASP